MAKHKAGIIGCGWFSDFYATALPSFCDRVQIDWVADPDPRRAAALGDRMGARVLTDYRQGLSDVGCVFVLVPHPQHHPIVMDCFSAGCHVMVEKPIALTLPQADEMIAAGRQAGKTLMVAYPHRYRHSMRTFKQAVTGGRYGKLFMLDGLMEECMQGSFKGWLANKESLGGGVFFSSSPHMLDVITWIGGEAQHIAMVGTNSGSELNAEDTAISVLKFKNGIIATTRHIWAGPVSRVWYTMQAYCRDAVVTLTTTPTGDLVTLGARCPWHTRVVATTPKGQEVLLDSPEGLDVGPEIEHFLDCVDTGRTPETDGRTARQLIELVFRAYGQAQTAGANV